MPPDLNLPPEPTPPPLPPPAPETLQPLNPMMKMFMQVALSSVGTAVRRFAVFFVGIVISHQASLGQWADLLVSLVGGAILAFLEWLIFNVRGRGAATLQETINHYVGEDVLVKDKWVDYDTVTEVQKLLPPK